MKKQLTLTCMLCLCHTLLIHSQNCEQKLKDAEASEKRGDYLDALRKFNAARKCDPSLDGRCEVKIESMFKKIDGLRKEAEHAKLEAEMQTKKVQELLEQLKITSDQAVTVLLAEIDRNILHLEYDSTFIKCQIAINLKSHHREVEKRIWEIAYFYTETDTTVAAIPFLNLLKPVDLYESASDLRQNMRIYLKKEVPQEFFTHLEKRYYPNLIEIEGGEIVREEKTPNQNRELVTRQVSSFKIAETETTFLQYFIFIKATNREIGPLSWNFSANKPVNNVNWFDAIFYANWLSEQKGLKQVYKITPTGRSEQVSGDDPHKVYNVSIDFKSMGYRLPTLIEWGFAEEGGNQSLGYKYSEDSTLHEVAWIFRNTNREIQPIKLKKSNEMGLFDMNGNVSEWCQDKAYELWEGGYYYTDPIVNQDVSYDSSEGGWTERMVCGCSVYEHYPQGYYITNSIDFHRKPSIGFRVALSSQ